MASKTFVFVVDTDSYAGNFEREMCAFMTGKIGDCEVGKEFAEMYYKESNVTSDGENEHNSYIKPLPDDHGCYRPCAVWTTPGWFNNGMGGHFKEGQEKEALEHHKQACLDSAKQEPYYKNKAANADNKKEWEEKAAAPLTKFSAYNSVAIFMDRHPTQKEIEELMERAHMFVSRHYTLRAVCPPLSVKISGFRIIEQQTVQKQQTIAHLKPLKGK